MTISFKCAGPASILVIHCFRYCAMSSVSWYFFISPFMLSLHKYYLFFGRTLLFLPETSSLCDFAQTWLCSRLKRWPNYLILVSFSRKVSTCFTCATTSFLTWSNLVFHFAHLNILKSAEFSLFSYSFFTAQHSESPAERNIQLPWLSLARMRIQNYSSKRHIRQLRII